MGRHVASFIANTRMWVMSLSSCYYNGDPCGFITFFCVSVAMHVTACDVRVTWQTYCTIMYHSLHRSTTIARRITPIHSEATACDAKKANVAVSESLFECNITFPL